MIRHTYTLPNHAMPCHAMPAMPWLGLAWQGDVSEHASGAVKHSETPWKNGIRFLWKCIEIHRTPLLMSHMLVPVTNRQQ